MKKAILVLMASVLVLGATGVSAQPYDPPVNGIYKTMDVGGTMLMGRFSESWVGPGTHGQLGNTVNAASWDGNLLGTEWRLWCPTLAMAPMVVSDTRDASGTGFVTYQTFYAGGFFWLTRLGPWSSDNLVDFTGTLSTFTALTTYHFLNNAVVGIVSNITTSGFFDQLDPRWSNACMEYTINNAAFLGGTDMMPKPADYPDFLDPALCPSDTGALNAGGWGTVTNIWLTISGCDVPEVPMTWGGLKSLHE